MLACLAVIVSRCYYTVIFILSTEVGSKFQKKFMPVSSLKAERHVLMKTVLGSS